MSQIVEVPNPHLDGLTPRQIVSELDKYIVGQAAAKKSVAIALRNRMRRQFVDEEIRAEIKPKNILMIGPTGVGKTEISRRLARLTTCPFVKVEATKFTEVGTWAAMWSRWCAIWWTRPSTWCAKKKS